ncbi:MAG: hypothetical protein RMM17_06635 [Acidobacteriota bacterium]|nr:hypothetical protein [Blastocatellia bacterium]MDW8412340.1 hypothetical protein [Acidobacteriota bacterium]
MNFCAKLFAIWLLFITVGCVKTTRHTAITLQTYDGLSAAQLIERINSRKANELSAGASITVIDLSKAKEGKVEPYRPADGLIVLQRPEMIRLLVRIPIIKQNIADMVSNGEKFSIAVYYPEKYRQFLTGSNASSYEDRFSMLMERDPKAAEFSSFVRIRPQHLTEALLPRPVSIGQSYFVVDRLLEEDEQISATKRRRVLKTYQVLHVLDKGADGQLYLQREFWFDRTSPSLPLAKLIVYGASGMITSEIAYKEYKYFEDGTYWPRQVVIKRAPDRYAMELNFHSVNRNFQVTELTFRLENRENLPFKDLDATSNLSPKASPDR